MASIAVNEFLVPVRQPDDSIAYRDLSGTTSIVQNVTAKLDEPASQAFTLVADTTFKSIGSGVSPSTLAVTVASELVIGATNQYKLTFSGDGAPNGFLKDGAYRVKHGNTVIGSLVCLFGARVETFSTTRAIVDQQQTDAFAAVFSGDQPYNVAFDANLDGEVKTEDSNEMTARAGSYWVKK